MRNNTLPHNELSQCQYSLTRQILIHWYTPQYVLYIVIVIVIVIVPFVWTWVIRKGPIPQSCSVVGLSVNVKISSPGWYSIGWPRKLACQRHLSMMICHLVCNWCTSARRGIFNSISLWNTTAPGDIFEGQW